MSNLFLRKILSGQAEPVAAIQAESNRQFKNPFLQASYQQKNGFIDDCGVNLPLRHPMFVGYRDNKPIYAGSRLFVLY